MINCDNLLERGGLRKVVYRKGAKESKGEKKRKTKW